MEVEVHMLLREVGQHRGGDVSRLPQICADAGAEIVSRSRSVVAQFEGAGRPVHARVVHGSWFERCTGAQSSSVKAAAGGTDRREAAAAPAALPPSSTACCREMGGGERRAASRGMVKHARSIPAPRHARQNLRLSGDNKSTGRLKRNYTYGQTNSASNTNGHRNNDAYRGGLYTATRRPRSR